MALPLDVSTMTGDVCLLMEIFMPVKQSYNQQLFVILRYKDGIQVIEYIDATENAKFRPPLRLL